MQTAYEAGASLSQIATSLRRRFPTLACATVRNVLLSRGVKMRPSHAVTPISQASVVECARLVRAGIECSEIARRFGLTPHQVRYRARLSCCRTAEVAGVARGCRCAKC